MWKRTGFLSAPNAGRYRMVKVFKAGCLDPKDEVILLNDFKAYMATMSVMLLNVSEDLKEMAKDG